MPKTLPVILCGRCTIIMTETADDPQKTLDEFNVYCSQWEINVNVKQKEKRKTKQQIY